MPVAGQPKDAESLIGKNWITIKTWIDGSLAFTLLNGQQPGDFWMRNDVRRLVHHCYINYPQIVNYAASMGWKLDYGFYLLHEHVNFKAITAGKGYKVQCLGGRIQEIPTKKLSEKTPTNKDRHGLRQEIEKLLASQPPAEQVVTLLRYIFCHSRDWSDLMYHITPDQLLFPVQVQSDFTSGGLVSHDWGIALAPLCRKDWHVYSCFAPQMYGTVTEAILSSHFRHEQEICKWRL